ncbi:MAG: N-acetylmuramoyl-L-alanine amidase [Bacteroidetes bacterium]|nr:N-acetylmuramoyl-L-alanine amidase [Bacteroidota bacterium]
MKVIRLLGFLLVTTFATSTHAQLLHDVIHHEVEMGPPDVTVIGKTTTVQFITQDLHSEFTGVALQGFTSSDSLAGDVRFWIHGEWSEWQSLYIVRSATDPAFLAAYRRDQPIEASQFEVRFQINSIDTIEALSVGTFDQRLDDEEETGYSPRSIEGSDNFVIRPPDLYRRAVWGAKPFRGTPIPLNRPTYNYMTLHHTAGFSATTLAEGLEQVFRIQEFHQNGRGWSDIGYQFLMDQEGRLYQGRPFLNEESSFDQGPRLVQGAHVGGANTGNIGVSLMGCYHPPAGGGCRDAITLSAIDSLVTTFSFLSERYEVSPDRMRGHRDFNATSCPGDNNYSMISEFMVKIEDLLLRGSVQIGSGLLTARLNESGTVWLKWTFTADYGIESFTIRRIENDGNTVDVFRGTEIVDGVTIDTPRGGDIVYEFVVQNRANSQQRLATAEIVVEPHPTSVLSQSFPNPTSSQTTFRYFLKDTDGIVTVSLFDMAGREVFVGEKQYRESGQWYATTIDTSTLSGGIYLYRVLVDGFATTTFNATKPLVVLR